MKNEFEMKDYLQAKRENINSFDDLIKYLEYIKENCNYDYGVAPRSIAQASLAVASYLAKEFGITGFQASYVMWDFIEDWQYSDNKCGLKIINYDYMLYPQYEHKFEKTISKDTWEHLQEQAKLNLEKHPNAHPNVIKHWEDIVIGKIPFGYKVAITDEA